MGRQVAGDEASPEPVGHSEPAVDDRLEYCMTSWRSQNPFEDADQFQQRLTLDNLTEDDLRRMLAEPADQVRNRLPSTPGWITTIEVALVDPADLRVPSSADRPPAGGRHHWLSRCRRSIHRWWTR